MRCFLAISFMVWLPSLTFAQDSINPYHIALPDTIILQNTDVYYKPFAPPVPTDTREQLSNIAYELRDPNGVNEYFKYDPMTNGSHLSTLYGDTALWMRLFQAARKSDGTRTDIIAGSNVTNDTMKTNGHHGEVIISKNEDVDFRASGMIKLEAGVHGMPGGFFHAYIDPKWDTTRTCTTAGDSGSALLFCDEFDSTSPKWPIVNGRWLTGNNCDLDSNVTSNYSDTAALDGHSLRIAVRLDSCNCATLGYPPYTPQTSACLGTNTGCAILDIESGLGCTPTIDTFGFSSAQLLSCPWPFKSVASLPDRPVSQNLPYGKYEMREKLPVGLFYEANTYTADQQNEWNMGETYNTDSTEIMPGLAVCMQYGPFKGKFATVAGDTVLRSRNANFAPWNNPTIIIIDGFPYSAQLNISVPPASPDTFVSFPGNTSLKGGIPTALFNADSVTFYYQRNESDISDSLPWSVDSTGRYFTGFYAIDRHRDSLRFTKQYQPTSIQLSPPRGPSYSCRWDSATGLVFLNPPVDPTYPHSGFAHLPYTTAERRGYPQPWLYNHSGQYHVYTIEFLPHEWRFLEDGMVVRREPDRLIPKNDKRYDFVTHFPRMLTPVNLGEIDIGGPDWQDSIRRADFITRYGTQTNEYIDYFKVWDLPSNITVPKFPY